MTSPRRPRSASAQIWPCSRADRRRLAVKPRVVEHNWRDLSRMGRFCATGRSGSAVFRAIISRERDQRWRSRLVTKSVVTLRYLTSEGVKAVPWRSSSPARRSWCSVCPAPTRTAVAHLPGYVTNAAARRPRGAAMRWLPVVNEPFVMDAWGKEHGDAGTKVTMRGEGSDRIHQAIGSTLDRTEAGLAFPLAAILDGRR